MFETTDAAGEVGVLQDARPPELPEQPDESASDEAGAAKDQPNPALVDRTQRTVFNLVNNTARWIDGFFGGSELEERPNVSYGRLNVGALWDERDDLRERLRLRARVPMPALERRTQLILGRGDTEDFVDGTDSDLIDRLPASFNDFEDDDWFFGVGIDGERRSQLRLRSRGRCECLVIFATTVLACDLSVESFFRRPNVAACQTARFLAGRARYRGVAYYDTRLCRQSPLDAAFVEYRQR